MSIHFPETEGNSALHYATLIEGNKLQLFFLVPGSDVVVFPGTSTAAHHFHCLDHFCIISVSATMWCSLEGFLIPEDHSSLVLVLHLSMTEPLTPTHLLPLVLTIVYSLDCTLALM